MNQNRLLTSNMGTISWLLSAFSWASLWLFYCFSMASRVSFTCLLSQCLDSLYRATRKCLSKQVAAGGRGSEPGRKQQASLVSWKREWRPLPQICLLLISVCPHPHCFPICGMFCMTAQQLSKMTTEVSLRNRQDRSISGMQEVLCLGMWVCWSSGHFPPICISITMQLPFRCRHRLWSVCVHNKHTKLSYTEMAHWNTQFRHYGARQAEEMLRGRRKRHFLVAAI